MTAKNPQIDAYIISAAPFARPILEHLRELVHKACPTVEETLKWHHPFFQYKGAILCNMAAFKQHCSFGFWKAALLPDPAGVLHLKDKESAGHFGHLRSLEDLPSDKILLALIREAAGLNEVMGKLPQAEKPAKKKALPKKELPKK